MWRILKWLFILVLIGFVGLIAYAYIGPFLGVDFSPDQGEIREPVSLNAQ